jgi:RNA polymerase sigma-70 factor (ECF subfamily)
VLLVCDAVGAPKISKYLGHGPLESWVAVTAIRVAVSFGRSESAERRLRDKAVADAAGGVDPEALAIKGELRRELEVAIEGALRRIEDRERLILRLYLVSGMTLAAIGKSFGVSQATVSRWLVKARESVLADVRRQLGERLQVPRGELASIARLVASQIDISISRLLGAA